MAEYKLKLENREVVGKKLKDLRKTGVIPSVVYGGKEPILLASEYVATDKVLRRAGFHSPIDLDMAGKKQMAIVKNVDIDPVTRQILNVEFKAISARAEVVTTTPIVIVNFEESEAAQNGHFATTQAISEIDVKAKPKDLPHELTIDASKMVELEDKLKLADIVLPEGVEFADKELDLEQVVVSLYDPAAEAEKRAAAEAAEAAAEAEETAEAAEESSAEEAAENTEAAESEADAEEKSE